ncbi:MAG: BREX-3 system phosphatase PglZ [Chloroflexi bacterium]|nr:BREX-3 system phosphatase PglZ [Chloroflexota bacterium]
MDEPDPIALRHRVEALRPWSIDHSLIVVTARPLNQLPYDLWQQGHHVTLALHTFFPNLAYPVARALAPSQRYRLSQSPPPPRRLGRQGTVEFLLRHVFAANLDALRQPAMLIAWLDQYHQQSDPMPAVLADHLLAHLQSVPTYGDWPLDELLANRDAFAAFVREQWCVYVQKQTGQLLSVREEPVVYLLDFETDHTLQDSLPGLVRSGALEPVSVDRPDRLPHWTRPAILAPEEDRRPRRAAELLSILTEYQDAAPAGARWEQWQAIARAWAELTTLRYDPDLSLELAQRDAYDKLIGEIDTAFLAWLRRRYAPLGSQRLPTPHHLYHVPHYIAYQRRQGAADRVALLILDGMALADWILIGPTWRARHPDWRFEERLLLAQIPTLTAVSRQALVSGLRPADFATTLDTTRAEPKHWAAFWAREGLPADVCSYAHLALDRSEPPPESDSARTRALCLIENKIDDLVHDATLGTKDFYASLRVWLEGYGRRVEKVIESLLARGFTVYLASDHGHVEARGFGRPSEGLAVDTRGRRARIYSDRRAADNVQRSFSETILWSQDDLLPDDVWALMPQGRSAFDTFNESVVTHGGPTLDEVIVPLVTVNIRE